MTVATNALLEGTRRAHRVRRDRGVHRRRRARPPGAARALPAVRCAPRAADAAGAALRRARAHRARRRARAARRDLDALADAVAGAEPEAVAVCLLHSYRHPEHERAIGAALRERLGRPRLAVARGRRHLPRVRARGDDRGRRRPLPPAGALPAPAARRVARRRAARPRRSCSPAAAWPRSTPPPTTPRSPCSAARPAARRPRRCSPSAAASPTCCASTWAAPRATCASSRAAACARRRRARSAAGRWRCRWSTSTPSAPAAARSAGATRAARCAWGRAARAPSPGPACYGRGGTEPTVTDANLVLGHLSADVPLAGDVELDARRGAARPSSGWPASSASTSRECAEGIVRVANAEMVRALRVMTVERGIDPRRFALLAFGGAGPLHAAAIAEELGMTRDPRPARLGRAQRARPGRRATAAPTRSAPSCGRRRRGVDALADEVRAALGGEPRDRGGLGRCATAASRTSSPSRRASATSCASASRRCTRSATATATPTARSSSSPSASPAGCPAAPVDFGAPAGERGRRGPTVVALPEATLVVPEGWSGTTDDTGTLVAGAARR